MDKKSSTQIPVKLYYLSGPELFAIVLVAGTVSTVAYQLGKRNQRKWVEQNIKRLADDGLKK